MTMLGGTSKLLFKREDTTTIAGNDLGAIEFSHTDSADAGTAAKILGEGDGSDGEGRITFYTGTPSALSEMVRIDHDGNVGIGTNSPSSSTTHMAFRRSTLDRTQLVMGHSNTGSRTLVSFFGNGSQAGSINVSPSATSYGTSSDYRLKTSVEYDLSLIHI